MAVILRVIGAILIVAGLYFILWGKSEEKKFAKEQLAIASSTTEHTDEDGFLWQSFDYPTDTLLPEMKNGWDKKTSILRIFTAWKNWDDPSSGDFTASMRLTNNPETAIWKGSTEFYRSGPLTGGTSSGAYEMKVNPLTNLELVNNEEQVYYMYTLKNKSVISIIVLSCISQSVISKSNN
ncbi:hypothetical protein RYX36_010350 [Vicia faba]